MRIQSEIKIIYTDQPDAKITVGFARIVITCYFFLT